MSGRIGGGMAYISPYSGIPPEKWMAKTQALVEAHPLDPKEIVDIVLVSWTAIFESRLGGKFRIGADITPKPQIMGFLLHELIPLELASRHNGVWRPEKEKTDKDISLMLRNLLSLRHLLTRPRFSAIAAMLKSKTAAARTRTAIT